MKTLLKIMAAVLVIVMAASLFAACGTKDGNSTGKSGDAASSDTVKGEVKTRNGISVLVPDGYEFPEEGIYVDALVRNKDDSTKYVQLNKFDTVEEAIDSMNINIGDTEFTEVEFEAAGVTWTGKQYDVMEDWTMVDAVATFGDTVIMAHASDFDWADDTYRTIMGSIVVG